MADFIRACSVDQVPEKTALRVMIDGAAVCVVRSDGDFYALHDVCSHADVPLSEGDVENGTIECWLHGSRFDLSSGRPTGLPATRPVPVYSVKRDGDDLLVRLEES